MRETFFRIALCALLFALCDPVQAQQRVKVPRIGYLSSASPSSTAHLIKAFREGLNQLGYVEGQNITIEYRYAEGKIDRLPDLAAELVRLKVDIILASGGSTLVLAAKKASETIPIVMTNSADPVGSGLVASLAQPGGNVTGLSTLALELGGKRLELLKETVPKLSRVAVLGTRDTPNYGRQMKEIEVAAQVLGVQLLPVEMREPSDLENAFAAITKGRAGAVMGLIDPRFTSVRGRIAELAAKSRLPAIYPQTEFPDIGGLMSYGPEYRDLFRRAATYVDKILKGRKPADLPVEQPTKFEFVVNLKTAKQIGLTIPPNVLVRADRVIR